jgi:CRP/FNR family transcriptional regulator
LRGVELKGVEPSTSSLRTTRSGQLSYSPGAAKLTIFRSVAQGGWERICELWVCTMEHLHDPELAELLRTRFSDIYEPEARQAILEHSKPMRLKAGDTWMEIGAYIKAIPMVLEGQLKLLREGPDGDEMLLYFVGPGETCAMSLTCCTSDARSTIRVVAEEDTLLLAVPARFMDQWTEEFRSWKSFVMLSYQRRFEELLQTIDGIAFQKLDARILDLLRERARVHGSPIITTTHQEIAQELHSSREVISRLLKRMEREGLVKLGRQRVELLAAKRSV